jgi:hypothetical protein
MLRKLLPAAEKGIPEFNDDKTRIFIPEYGRDMVRIYIPDNGRDSYIGVTPYCE